ncbi:MAG: adenylyltransferase/cytidyltransferase family protein [Humidesulfovibrio sp.]|nr:adenylyltransferase/cytidyltransferase family protein [Humidesulfovibrio sp.]
MAELRERGVVTGLAHGCFDLLHLGHVRYLARARERCDFLAVTLTPDAFVGKGALRPVFPEEQRAEVLAALDMVDAVAVNRWPTAVEALSLLQPTRYFKGLERRSEMEDPSSVMHAEALACHAAGGRVEFIDDLVFSSTSVVMRYYSPLLREGWMMSR